MTDNRRAFPVGRRGLAVMATMRDPAAMTRRAAIAFAGALCLRLPFESDWRASADVVAREMIATVTREAGFSPPLTLGIARVVLRPGASSWAAIPPGVRIIVVESGMLGLTADGRVGAPVMANELAADSALPDPDSELILPTGTVMTFGARGIAGVRNAGIRPTVLLDAAVFHDEPRTLARAFTTNAGVSFQLLANADADAAPTGKGTVTLERVSLGHMTAMPADLGLGLTLIYVEAGTLDLVSRRGSVSAARAAAAAPYAMPGALQLLISGEDCNVTAGGVVYLPLGAEAELTNPSSRTAELLVLAVREAG
jgi:hypothetical protein